VTSVRVFRVGTSEEQPIPERTITQVPGVEVGHVTDLDAMTGVTVITFAEPNVAVVDVRGGAPGSRELAAFGDAIKPVTINALVFSGGSAFGLAAADGVMGEIEREGRGAPTPAGPVPIVPAAIIFDLLVGRSDVRPTAEDGRAAYLARSTRPVATGAVGAGTGATVGKINGLGAMSPGGVGSAATGVDDAVVGALVVVNAVGDVYDLSGHRLTGSSATDLRPGESAFGPNTTLIAVATDAAVDDRNELRRLAVRAHDALAATVRPAHTRYDGDTVFVVASGRADADIDALGEATFGVVASAIVGAIEAAAR
jgi:L-aminopeptidase/D-esterase-like protein